MQRTVEHNAAISRALKANGRGASLTKRCPRCKLTKKRVRDFRVRSNGYTVSYCRACEAEIQRADNRAHPEKLRERNWRATLRRHSGATPDYYYARFKKQKGRCAICARRPEPRKKLGVDHDHRNGRLRGLLCDNCNRALGLFQDDAALLSAAIAYLGHYHDDDEGATR